MSCLSFRADGFLCRCGRTLRFGPWSRWVRQTWPWSRDGRGTLTTLPRLGKSSRPTACPAGVPEPARLSLGLQESLLLPQGRGMQRIQWPWPPKGRRTLTALSRRDKSAGPAARCARISEPAASSGGLRGVPAPPAGPGDAADTMALAKKWPTDTHCPPAS